jgi:hypothetical protein
VDFDLFAAALTASLSSRASAAEFLAIVAGEATLCTDDVIRKRACAHQPIRL